ncbi:MAG: BTAD domain-containing putative transcriptional regulator [Solirubrobacteraceae bacterium]
MTRFRVLGPVEAWTDERQLTLGGPQQVKLLAFLLLNANRAVSADAVIDAVWGAGRDGAVKRLQMGVFRLRKGLAPLDTHGGPRLRTVSGGYLLSVRPGELDAEVFTEEARGGRRALDDGDPVRARDLLVRALALWRGAPLGEVAFEDFAQADIRRLEELRLWTLESRVEAELQLGRHAELIAELEGLLAEQPTREHLAAQLMTALYRSGRQARALEVYQRTRTRLAEDLGLDPGVALKAIQTQILEHASELETDGPHGDASRLSGSDTWTEYRDGGSERPVVPVPLSPTPTIGRAGEVEAVCGLLVSPDSRLVTLTGPGGVGKTRLAMAVAHAIGSSFPDGACWVELAGLARAEDVGSAVVGALGLEPLGTEGAVDTLSRYLGRRRLLLVIDNFEHVLGAAGLVGQVHAVCRDVAILSTSREPLDLGAEHRVPVAPLAIPAVSDRINAAEVEAADASALFLAAVRRRDSHFAVHPGSASAIARICAALDGLPLALELAAARTGLLGIEDLAARLEDGWSALGRGPRDAPARHGTLERAIGWSYGLLDREQQSAFVGFAVFAGGATVDAAEVVTGASLQTLEALTAKSLLYRRQEPDGTVRLVMLETIREYALRRPNDSGERSVAYRRHFEHYLRILEEDVARFSTHQERQALAALERDIDNLRAALQWALRTKPEGALRLAGFLAQYWRIRGDASALFWIDAAVHAAGNDVRADDRARAQLERCYQLSMRQRRAEASDAAGEALRLFRQAGDHSGIAHACCACSMGAYRLGDREGERSYAEMACRHARIAGDPGLRGKALARLAWGLSPDQRSRLLDQAAELLEEVGDYRELAGDYLTAAYVALQEDRIPEAIRLVDAALAAARNTDSPATEMLVLGNLGLARLFCGELLAARTAFEHQLRLCMGHAFRYGADEGLAGLAAVAAAQGQPERAATLRGAARALGYPQSGDEVIDDRLEREYFAPAQASWGIAAWRQAEALGARFSYDDALASALEPSAPAVTSVRKPAAPTRVRIT